MTLFLKLISLIFSIINIIYFVLFDEQLEIIKNIRTIESEIDKTISDKIKII